MNKWPEKLMIYLTFFIVFITPILYFGGSFFTPYVTSKTFVFYGLTEIIFVLWLYIMLVYDRYKISKKTWLLFSPLITFIGWFTITGIFGVNPEMSFWSSLGRGTGLLTLYHCLALSVALVSIIIVQGFEYIKTILMWFLGGSFVVALSVWFGNEGFNLPFEFLQKSKGGGLIGNSSLTASYLLFSFFFGLFLLFAKEVSRRQKIWIGIILVVIISSPLFLNINSIISKGTLLISARGALLGLASGLLLVAITYFALSNKKILKYTGIAGLLVGLGVFIFGWLSLITPGSIIHEKFAESATASRFIFWNIAEKGINERPIIGWGPENYSVVYQKYFDPQIMQQSSTTAEVWVDRPHNILSEVGVAGGYPAIILYILVIVSLFVGVFRSYQSNRINKIQAGVLWGLVVGYFIQNLFVFDSLSSYLGFLVLTSIIFGINNNQIPEPKNNDRNLSENNILIGSILFVLLIVALVFFVVLPLRKTAKISEIFTLPLNKRFEQYNNLLKISPVGDAWEIGKLAEDTYKLYSSNLKEIKEDERVFVYSKKDLEAFLKYLEVIASKEPYDYRLHLNIMRLTNIYAKLYEYDNMELIQHISDLGQYTRNLSPNHFNLIYPKNR